MFEPTYTITAKVTKALMTVEASRQAITRLPLTVPMLDSLRKTARLLSTHYSTQIEGNELSRRRSRRSSLGAGTSPGASGTRRRSATTTAPSNTSRV